MPTAPQSSQNYALGHSEPELERLIFQAHLLEPFTRQVFLAAGIVEGMRVLDIGSGAGDVAFLAASLVGRTGSVVGIDRAAAAIAAATKRAEALGLSNVRFLEGDPAGMQFEQPFDAVVGRFVLMFLPDPTEIVRRLVAYLCPGGVIAFLEALDMNSLRSYPPVPLFDRCVRWNAAALQAMGAEPQMGLKLFPLFIDAGLPAPTLQTQVFVGGGADNPGYRVVAETARSLLSVMTQFGIATAEEVAIDTLAERMRDEIVAAGSVIVSPIMAGAFSRKPSAPARAASKHSVSGIDIAQVVAPL
ncbi:MAG TPA: class I SAM-dependent methyltransferase [Bryobacteraceae bacterium]|nr:class I SAM-dependent methyltransferase [Bryobacteraceae bacterium]